jgi:hypothetical protein
MVGRRRLTTLVKAIIVTLTGATDDALIVAFGAYGAESVTPWDANAHY